METLDLMSEPKTVGWIKSFEDMSRAEVPGLVPTRLTKLFLDPQAWNQHPDTQ